jgi:hypothetical protein
MAENSGSEMYTKRIEFQNYGLLGCDAVWYDRYKRFAGSCCLHLKGRVVTILHR